MAELGAESGCEEYNRKTKWERKFPKGTSQIFTTTAAEKKSEILDKHILKGDQTWLLVLNNSQYEYIKNKQCSTSV